MKLSVHILTYNSERYIKDAIDSVLNQKINFPFELVIGDDASTDNTFKILQDYAKTYEHVKPFQNKKNLGILKNFKNTLDQCSGEYIFDLAGDDWIHNEIGLQKMVEKLESNPNLGFIDSGYNVFYEHRNKSTYFHNKNILNKVTYRNHMLTTGSPTLGCCFRKNALDLYVDFDLYIKKGFKIEDYPILADLTSNCTYDFIYESFVTYRVRKTSYSSNFHDFFDMKMYFVNKYNLGNDAVQKIEENYFQTKLIHASLHFRPKDGALAFSKIKKRRLKQYLLYISSQSKFCFKILWFFRRLAL